MNWAEDSNIIPEWQPLIQNRLNMDGKKLFVLFIDFKSAFPFLNHTLLLLKKTLNLGNGTKFVNIISDFYSKACLSQLK